MWSTSSRYTGMREWFSSASSRSTSVGGVEISTVTTSVRGTITSRQRLSDSSKMERMSCGALLSTSLLAACAVSSFSSSSRGGGGGSKRSVRPKVRATRLSTLSSTRMGG